MARARYGNLEEARKYWEQENKLKCKFCKEGKDHLYHFVAECEVAKTWLKNIPGDTGEKISQLVSEKLNTAVMIVLKKIVKEKGKLYKAERDSEARTNAECGSVLEKN